MRWPVIRWAVVIVVMIISPGRSIANANTLIEVDRSTGSYHCKYDDKCPTKLSFTEQYAALLAYYRQANRSQLIIVEDYFAKSYARVLWMRLFINF
jgi:hypothetical protein